MCLASTIQGHVQMHSIPTHTPATRLGHTADCNLPIHKPAIRLDTTFKLCEVHRHVHWATSPYTSTSTWSHHVLYNQSHMEGREHSFCLIHYVQPTETCICLFTPPLLPVSQYYGLLQQKVPMDTQNVLTTRTMYVQTFV